VLARKLSITTFLWIFTISQFVIISIFLGHRGDTFITFDNYLQSVKYVTLLLLVLSVLLVLPNWRQIKEFEPVKYIFVAQILILYFVMVFHTDIKAINSPTIALMLILTIAILIIQIDLRTINLISVTLAFLNILFVAFQIAEIIPVAQDNIREGLGLISDRPTGILFNAFAMSYASVITFAISAYFLKKRNLIIPNLLAVIVSVISILLSATRTPILLVAVIGLLIYVQDQKIVQKNWRIISIIVPSIFIAFPVISIIGGNQLGNNNLATLNGRTQLWTCVTSRWEEFLPFGVGVQAAFPNGFCSDDEWFSKLRHPENMFLLNYVESGIFGLLGLVALFVITFWASGKAIAKGSALPMAITTTFFMSSIFYVPLFHYLPFLENRTANRGVFNFFLFTFIWMAVLAAFNKQKVKQ
jgi:O-antigen ligase